VRIAVAACVAAVLAGGLLLAQAPSSAPAPMPVTIQVLGAATDAVSLQTDGAWPLTIRMAAADFLGIGTYSVPYLFPRSPQRAFIVFANPDGCFSLSRNHDTSILDPETGLPVFEACPDGRDETYMEFTPTINMANLYASEVAGLPRARLGPSPILKGWSDGDGNSYDAKVGPHVGDNTNDDGPCIHVGDPYGVCDNYGYGASPNLPGLVILSNRGVGLVWDDPAAFHLADPLAARNLAGLVNSIAWTLNDCEGPGGCGSGRSTVTAQMNVPLGLFKPVVRLDLGWTTNGVTKGRWYQTDGGRWINDHKFDLVSELNTIVTTVRVFVVSGRAPDVLEDVNGDRRVDVDDAVAAGYTVLSNQAIFRLRTYSQSLTPGNSDLAVLYDKDGDGMQGDVAPAGSGGVTPIPR